MVPDTKVVTLCLVGPTTIVNFCLIVGDCRVDVFFVSPTG